MATEAEGPQERRLAAKADPVVARRYLGAALCFGSRGELYAVGGDVQLLGSRSK